MDSRKRPRVSNSDVNNNKVVRFSSTESTKKKSLLNSAETQQHTIGQIKELRLLNFMCHKNFAIEFHATPMQIVTGSNGSGKSTIANAVCLCLGAQARSTGRTTNVQSFIRKGESYAEVSIILANEGREAYKPELYGREIHIIRRIGAKQSTYKILGEKHKVISTRKETISEINQALSISPENPLCVLHQEVAKTFLMNSDSQKKYQFYMRVSQLDQMKQAYEAAVYTVQSIYQRVTNMKNRHKEMLRAVEPLEREIKKVNIRRVQERKKYDLEVELVVARHHETEQELVRLQNELDATQHSKDMIEIRSHETTARIHLVEQKIEVFQNEKSDIEKDLTGSNGLRGLNHRFAKEKKELELMIYRLSRDCEKRHEKMKEIDEERINLRKHINESNSQSQDNNQEEEERRQLEREIQQLIQQTLDDDKAMASLLNDLTLSDEHIRQTQATVDCIQNELKQKQNDLDTLRKIEADQNNAYGTWISGCLQAIAQENRFHKKPIGPIGHHIRCIDQRWSYAVEKHLASIMSAFICSDAHDERVLLEIFQKYSHGNRPTIFVMKYVERAPNISGTLERIRNANLLSIYQVLTIQNATVESALIDIKQIEATILVDDLQHAKRIRQSGILRWPMVHKKVKQVSEAWTNDGANIKLDKAFRIYTNDRQPARYFKSSNVQSLSTEELNAEITQMRQQMERIKTSLNELKKTRQTTASKSDKSKKANSLNQNKIKELNKKLEQMPVTLPITYDYTAEEYQERLNEYNVAYTEANQKFDEAREKLELEHQNLAEIEQQLQNIIKKIEGKTTECEALADKIQEEQLERQQLEQELPGFTRKVAQCEDDIQKYRDKLKELSESLPKKLKSSKTTNRSVREIQQEINAIDNFLKSNEDTLEQRRLIIDDFKTKRDAAENFKKIYERCLRQVKNLEKFVNRRKERFGNIADQQQYLLRHNFKNLMENYRFDDCDIKIDHKKEQLEIIIRKNQRSVASLSGGERSVSTFCFLLALWGSIYQPFRLLDEIDIYMDNEKRNLSLEHLYENTKYYSSSQHVIFTPQAIDPEMWKQKNVPVFRMPTPKRSLE